MELPDDISDAIAAARIVIAAAILALLWHIETIAPMVRDHRQRLRHGAANVGLAGINVIVGFGFAFALAFAADAGARHEWGVLYRVALPEWQHWLLALVLFDAWQYAWHRLNHRVPFLWRFHAVHHADAEMDVTSAVRFHPVEIALSSIARLAVVPLLGMSLPMLLLYEAVALPVILFHHSNIRIGARLDRSLRWLLVTPWMHRVHHSHWQPETDSNYASLLSVWDRVFGSFQLRAHPERLRLGLDGWRDAEWRSLSGMIIAPLRRQQPGAPATSAPTAFDQAAEPSRTPPLSEGIVSRNSDGDPT